MVVPEHHVFDPANSGDRSRYDRLVELGGMHLHDTTATQLQSLRALLPTPPEDVLDEEVRWVHYPWRRAVVRVLGPRGFRLLRLDRNRNKITAAEQAAMARLRVGVVGLSVGHAVAHTLAIEGLCGELRLADFDDLDLSNLNRVPASLFDLDINKTVVAARRIAELDPYMSVVTFPDGLVESTFESFMDGLDIVIDECDSLDTKLVLREHARRRGIPVVMETSDGGILDVERFDLEPERPLLHGLLGDLDASALKNITPEQKAPLAARILDPSKLTPRMLASVPEIGRTLSTWPQLGSDVALGGASVAAVVRAFGLGTPPPSGRVRINLDAHLATITEVEPPASADPISPANQPR
ncbi:MAG: Rv1355c family protein [Rhodococcus sp. (in: high G+C Gram-positive bacteria)]